MEYRNSSGGQHIGHAAVFSHESSHGVELTGGSTGGVIRTASDDASARLLVQAKGPSGILALGTSTGGNVTLDGSSFAVAAPARFTGVTFAVDGASSIALAPTSTAGITIGNSSNPVEIAGSSVRLTSTHINLNSTRVNILDVLQITSSGIRFGSSAGTNQLITISNSSVNIELEANAVFVGATSTTAITVIQRYAIDFTPPVLAVSEAAWQTYTVTGLSTQSAVFISPHLTFSSNYTFCGARCSTADQLSVLWTNNLASTIGTGESTNQWRVIQFGF